MFESESTQEDINKFQGNSQGNVEDNVEEDNDVDRLSNIGSDGDEGNKASSDSDREGRTIDRSMRGILTHLMSLGR